MRRTAWLTVFMLALGLSWAQAQESGEGKEADKKNAISVFVGALSNLGTNETGAAVGVDFTREVSEKLGIVGFAEWANAGEREGAFGGRNRVEAGRRVQARVRAGGDCGEVRR